MPKISTSLKAVLVVAAIVTAFGGGYLVGVRQESTQLMASVYRSFTIAHLPGHARDLKMLSLLASLETDEYLARRQEMLCKVIRIKAGIVADMFKAQSDLDVISPPRPELALVTKMLAFDADDAKKTYSESVCAQLDSSNGPG